MALESVLETELVPESAPKLVLEVVLTKLEQQMATDELVLHLFAQIRCPKKETGMKHKGIFLGSQIDERNCQTHRNSVVENSPAAVNSRCLFSENVPYRTRPAFWSTLVLLGGPTGLQRPSAPNRKSVIGSYPYCQLIVHFTF